MNAKPTRYALITGASSGIGKALANVFAKNGHNLVLVSRDKPRLESLAQTLSTTYTVDCRILASDLSLDGAADTVCSFLAREGLEVDCLVNNAGFTLHGAFINSDRGAEAQMLRLHAQTSIELVKLLAPKMEPLGGGHILHVSSLYAFTPVPNQSVYGATKAFLLSFSLATREELRRRNIAVCCLCPGITESEIRLRAGINAKESRLSMAADTVAERAYRGLYSNQAVIVPGLINKLFVLLVTVLPVSLHSRVMRWITYTLRGFSKK